MTSIQSERIMYQWESEILRLGAHGANKETHANPEMQIYVSISSPLRGHCTTH